MTTMDCVPKLDKQRSCSPGGGFVNRFGSGRRSVRFYRHLEDEEDELNPRESVPKWQSFWRKFKKGKRKIFNTSGSIRVAYDPYTYAQNFDQGSACFEAENLSRSFSARFAGPSNVFQRFG